MGVPLKIRSRVLRTLLRRVLVGECQSFRPNILTDGFGECFRKMGSDIVRVMFLTSQFSYGDMKNVFSKNISQKSRAHCYWREVKNGSRRLAQTSPHDFASYSCIHSLRFQHTSKLAWLGREAVFKGKYWQIKKLIRELFGLRRLKRKSRAPSTTNALRRGRLMSFIK